MLRDRIVQRGQTVKPQSKPTQPADAKGRFAPGPKQSVTVTASCGHVIQCHLKSHPGCEAPDIQIANKREVPCGPCRNVAHNAEVPKKRKAKHGWIPGTPFEGEGKPTKLAFGYEVDVLPVGTMITLRKVESNRWTSSLSTGDVTITAEAVGRRRQIARLATEYALRMGILATKESPTDG